MIATVLGNVFTLIATCFTFLTSVRTKKRDMIISDVGTAFFYTIADLILKGYSGVVQNVVGLIRNIVALFLPGNKYINWTLIACGVIFGVYFNNLGFVGLLPVAACCYYSICILDDNPDGKRLKIALIIQALCYTVYSAVLLNIVGVITNLITAVSGTVSLVRTYKTTNNN